VNAGGNHDAPWISVERHQFTNDRMHDLILHVIADDPFGKSCHSPDRGKWCERFRTGAILDARFCFVYLSGMATKTIALELDAYEKLRTARKAGESFSEVVRRASFGDAPLTGENLRAYLRSGGSGISERYLDAVEEAAKCDPLPDNPWA